jgi:hypothetical protein
MTRKEATEAAQARWLATKRPQVIYQTNIEGHFGYCSAAVWFRSQGKVIGLHKAVWELP